MMDCSWHSSWTWRADRNFRGKWPIFVLSILFVTVLPSAGAAETLAQALQSAAKVSPALRAEQFRSRAASAGIAIASAGMYPRVTASGDLGFATGPNGLATGSSGSLRPELGDSAAARRGYSLSAELPLFDGGRTKGAVSEARANAEGASAQVIATEAVILLEAVAAFADVYRDRKIEALRDSNRRAVEEEVKAATARMRRGAATETDVAQTRARHAQALADLIIAKSDARVGIAEYRRAIGHEPGKLQQPDVPAAALPKSLENAMTTAEAKNQTLVVANAKAEAARHGIERLAADGLPQVKLRGGVEGDNSFSSGVQDRNGASVAVRVVVPLYDGGETAARVEQARLINASLVEEARNIRERVRANVQANWTRLAAGRERLDAERRAIDANREALNSIKEAIKLGQRSTVEALDAQRDLVASEVRAAACERDLVVAAYSLLMATGQLDIDAAAPRARPIAGPVPAPAWKATVAPRK